MYNNIAYPSDLDPKLKAFTLKSPWLASAMMHGQKRIENRTQDWKPGWYAVHIGVGNEDPWCEQHVRENVTDKSVLRMIATDVASGYMRRGHIVGLVYISYTLAILPARLSQDGGWAMGPFCMMISHRVFLKNPIQCKGQLGAWGVKNAGDKMSGHCLLSRVAEGLCATVHANMRCNISENAGELHQYKQELLEAKRAQRAQKRVEKRDREDSD